MAAPSPSRGCCASATAINGEIRAVGAYIIDQVPLMARVGIDAFLTDDPVLIVALSTGEWPEMTHYLQPALDRGGEVPAGTRPWARQRATGHRQP